MVMRIKGFLKRSWELCCYVLWPRRSLKRSNWAGGSLEVVYAPDEVAHGAGTGKWLGVAGVQGWKV